MRPVRRGAPPQAKDYTDYRDAKPDLVARLGPYCSFCERRVQSNLAMEHVQPKGRPEYLHLIGTWSNFLLACVNCNSTKSDKDVHLSKLLLPDRDNTFHALSYDLHGTIDSSQAAKHAGLAAMVQRTLALTGLDKAALNTADANGRFVALDRVRQRREVWLKAEQSKGDYLSAPATARGLLVPFIIRQAQAEGFFSIWMVVFASETGICTALVDAFPGTRQSGCFAPGSGLSVTPAPNPDQLPDGGKL